MEGRGRAAEIPLFALNAVLFPGTWLPLRVFEPRYRRMLRDVLDADRTFGVALIKFGEEVGGPATPFRVGCRATVEEVAEDKGVFHLLVRGGARFEIEALLDGGPYPRARVRDLPPLKTCPADGAAADDLRLLHDLYVRTLHRAAGALGKAWPGELAAPLPAGDAAVVANWVAAGLGVEPTEKQALLECPTVARALAAERELLRGQLEKWEALLRRPTPG